MMGLRLAIGGFSNPPLNFRAQPWPATRTTKKVRLGERILFDQTGTFQGRSYLGLWWDHGPTKNLKNV